MNDKLTFWGFICHYTNTMWKIAECTTAVQTISYSKCCHTERLWWIDDNAAKKSSLANGKWLMNISCLTLHMHRSTKTNAAQVANFWLWNKLDYKSVTLIHHLSLFNMKEFKTTKLLIIYCILYLKKLM